MRRMARRYRMGWLQPVAQRNHHGLRGMVQVGFARPHGADRPIGAIELVEP